LFTERGRSGVKQGKSGRMEEWKNGCKRQVIISSEMDIPDASGWDLVLKAILPFFQCSR
jgi:hypothetical protein